MYFALFFYEIIIFILINSAKKFLIDLFFPPHCVNCNKEGDWLCNDCQGRIKIINSIFCSKCNMLTTDRKLCDFCRRNSNLKGILFLGYYSDEILKKAIWGFKYNFVKEVGQSLSLLLADYLEGKLDFDDGVLVAVPLNKHRLSWRGFNQSEILARGISDKLNIPFQKNVLERVKNTQSQIGLSRKERLENVASAFKVVDKIDQKRVFLVDDVFTTGSTLEECAKELKEFGVKEVWGVVLAKD